MKKIFFVILLLLCIFSLSGCTKSVSNSVDKNDVKLVDVPEDEDFTKEVSFTDFSKYVAYQTINDAFKNAKYDIWTLNQVEMSSIAISSVDKKTGERIAISKTKITCNNPFTGYNGNAMSYVRGNRYYSSQNLTAYYNASSGKRTATYSGKYYQDIPATDEKGVGSFFGDNAAENAVFTNPYNMIEQLKEGGIIEGGTIYKARANGYTYYKVVFSADIYNSYSITKFYLLFVMNGRKPVGMRMRVGITQGDMTNYLHVTMVPFKGNLDSVPETFEGYDQTLEEFMNGLSSKMVEVYR